MSKKMKDPRKQSFRATPFLGASTGEITGHEELWRLLFERLTAGHILALASFISRFMVSLGILATLFLEAIGIVPRSQEVNLLLVALSWSVVSGSNRAVFSIRHRSRH